MGREGKKWWTPKDVVFLGGVMEHVLGGTQPEKKKKHEYVLGYFTEIFQLFFKRLLNSTLLVNWHFLQSCVP